MQTSSIDWAALDERLGRKRQFVPRRQAAPDRDIEKPAISVIGLGYVGSVSMGCLSHIGFRVLGVDVCHDKVEAINAGRAPIFENRLGELLAEGVEAGLVAATDNLIAAVLQTDLTLISVGTPTADDGSCDLRFVHEVSRAIGKAIATKSTYHVVVLRCSVPPGTTLNVVAREIERASGKKLGDDFGICFNPEFLREGVAVDDFFAPAKTVVGASDERAASFVASIYEAVVQEVTFTSIAAAEMVKYVDNVWHAAKVAFANEVGRICKALHIDSHDVMDIFVQDKKLNLSPYYLKPGFAFGGSCLPKEVRAVSHLAGQLCVSAPLIDSLLPSNRQQISEAAELLRPHAGKRIGFLGLTFKPGTDDLRESPTLDLMAELLDRGESLGAYDCSLSAGSRPREQIDPARNVAPRLTRLLAKLESITVSTAEELLAVSDVVVVSHSTDEFRSALARRPPKTHVIDLVRLSRRPNSDPTYQGIAW
jgi:GDP-mannose 6-dehydrogenase